jgi:hypothetical protein
LVRHADNRNVGCGIWNGIYNNFRKKIAALKQKDGLE